MIIIEIIFIKYVTQSCVLYFIKNIKRIINQHLIRLTNVPVSYQETEIIFF